MTLTPEIVDTSRVIVCAATFPTLPDTSATAIAITAVCGLAITASADVAYRMVLPGTCAVVPAGITTGVAPVTVTTLKRKLATAGVAGNIPNPKGGYNAAGIA